jgi:RibD C-terminal domain
MAKTQYLVAASIDGSSPTRRTRWTGCSRRRHSPPRRQALRVMSASPSSSARPARWRWAPLPTNGYFSTRSCCTSRASGRTTTETCRAGCSVTEGCVPRANINFVIGDVRTVHKLMTATAGGRNVWVVGGGGLAGQFADVGLLDEIILAIAPVTLGSGALLLPRRLTAAELTLTDSGHDGTFAYLTYQVQRQPAGTRAPEPEPARARCRGPGAGRGGRELAAPPAVSGRRAIARNRRSGAACCIP